MAAATRYRHFMKLCQDWPLDATKPGRDFAAYMRVKVTEGFRQGESTTIANPDECDRKYDALRLIQANHYKNAHPRLSNRSASGLPLDQLKMVNSTEALEMVNKEHMSVLDKLKMKLKIDSK